MFEEPKENNAQQSEDIFFCHICHILKPELLLPKNKTNQIVISSGFEKQ
jgi:hypothetical protein